MSVRGPRVGSWTTTTCGDGGCGASGSLGPGFEPTAEGAVAAVRWLGAVQSQDHEPALWSLAQRAGGVCRAELAGAFDAAAFIRTHVLRPTWHFVPPEELRDLLALTAPRVAASCAGRWRELGLTAPLRKDATEVMAAAVAERGPLTRGELGELLQQAGIDPAGQRLPHLLIHAELEVVLCSGGLRGRQQTWALVDDRVGPAPGSEPVDRGECAPPARRALRDQPWPGHRTRLLVVVRPHAARRPHRRRAGSAGDRHRRGRRSPVLVRRAPR